MMILITLIIFSTICFILTYYFNLFLSQNVYTRREISHILPQLGNMINIILNEYSLFYLLVFYFFSSLIGVFTLVIFQNWVINSAILPLLFYYLVPRIAVYFEQTRVTISEDYRDIAEALFSKYYNYILIGFFCGFASKLIDNWINNGFIGFYWFIINFGIISALTVITLRKDIFK